MSFSQPTHPLITHESVSKAVSKIVSKDHAYPSYRRIRAEIGGGSLHDVSRFIHDIRKTAPHLFVIQKGAVSTSGNAFAGGPVDVQSCAAAEQMRQEERRLAAEQHTTALAAPQSESAASRSELHALTAEIAEEEQGYEDLAQEHDRIMEDRNQLAVTVAQQGAALTRMSAEIKDWQRQAADAQAAVETVNRLLSEEKAALLRSSLQLDQLRSELTAEHQVEQALDEARRENARLRGRLEVLEPFAATLAASPHREAAGRGKPAKQGSLGLPAMAAPPDS
ncbi:hypothetical protein [Azospirillum argentinense]|uniref:DNA-binding protein n=1 Tax=Azospirillum argentinense TaxID=2970906 RepID=UPI0032DF48B1